MQKEPLIYDLGVAGRVGHRLPDSDVPHSPYPDDFVRSDLDFPEVSEIDVVRHFTRLSQLNHGIDKGFYPLGSCTMKYNPRINEDMARLPGFAGLHPYQPLETVQGALKIIHEVQEWLKELGGFAAVSVQPAAGAHGEFAGILMMRAYHLANGDTKRNRILIPDSAHGTNPASTTMSGLTAVEIPSDARGNIDLAALRAQCDDTVVGIMITNPNTLGLFEEQILEVVEAVHNCGGLVYGDGANFNALMGIIRPGDIGFDVMHYNLHKTFSTPHGGGGPGSGPVGVTEKLAPFLPGPVVERINSADHQPATYRLIQPAQSIGRLKSFYGNFGMFVRAYTYMLVNGADGLKQVSEMAVLNANYIRAKVQDLYHVPFARMNLHEFVVEGHFADVPDVHALDISKRLMDYGFHPPTNYFPLIVHEALMIEPTETESKQTLDEFIEALRQIAQEAHTNPDILTSAPHTTPIGRLDEVWAAKQLVLCCRPVSERALS